MNSVERVAIRTRELRLKHGLTQQELAEVADFSEKFLQQIEAQRKKEIWLSTVERLAAAFSLELYEFLAPDIPKKSNPSKKVVSSRVHR
jgi:transcriptional regulator with XRE-family HTH domain